MRAVLLGVTFMIIFATTVIGEVLVAPRSAHADGGDSDYQICSFRPGPYYAFIHRDLDQYAINDENAPCVREVSVNVIRGNAITVCSASDQYEMATRGASLEWNDTLRATTGHEIFSFMTSDILCSAPVQTPSQRIQFEPGVWSVLVTGNFPGDRFNPDPDSANKEYVCYANSPLQSAVKGCYAPQNIWGNPMSSTSPALTHDGAPWYTAVGQSEIRLNPALEPTEFLTTITHELGHVLGFRDRSDFNVEGECDADDPSSIMGYGDCGTPEPTTDDVAQYVLIYTPNAPTGFSGTRVQGQPDEIELTWTAEHIHVEQGFRIDVLEEPIGAPQYWDPIVPLVTANSPHYTITHSSTQPRAYRVVAVTGALKGDTGDAASNTFTVPGIDVTLSGLAISGPTFAFLPDTTTYHLDVRSSRFRTTVTATASDSAATVVLSSGTNSGASPKVFDLGYGQTTIEVTVTNGGVARVYTLEITRPRPDTKLSTLTVTGATFTFDPDTTTHRVSVRSSRFLTTVTATASDSAATVVLSSGTNSGASPKLFDLGYGQTTIEVTVTNGGEARVYTLEITRPHLPPPPTYSWSASCGSSSGSGTEDTQAKADVAEAAWITDNCQDCTDGSTVSVNDACPTYSWSASCGTGSGSGTAATQALANAARAAWITDNCQDCTDGSTVSVNDACPPPPPTYSWSASCGTGSGSGTAATQALANAARAAWITDNCQDCTDGSTVSVNDACPPPPPTYSWSASCGTGSGSGTAATQALANAARAAWITDNCQDCTDGSTVSVNDACPTYSWSASCGTGSGSGTAATQALANAARAAWITDNCQDCTDGSTVSVNDACPTYSWSASCGTGSGSGTAATQALAAAAEAAWIGGNCTTCTDGSTVSVNDYCPCPDGFERINGQGPCVAECGDCQGRTLQGDCEWRCYSGEVCIDGRCGDPCEIPGFPCGRQRQGAEEETTAPTSRTTASTASTATATAQSDPWARASAERTAAAAAQVSPMTVAASGHLLGGDGAAVRIVVYEDFGCSFCREFGREVIPVLEEEYIDAGTASLEYRHLAILGQESVVAAAAAECAADQELFWPYHDLLVGETTRTYKEHARTLQASEAGAPLDLDTFDACVDAGTHVAAVQAATAAARDVLTGSGSESVRIAVPLFLVDDAFWRIGIPTMDEFRTEIARARAGSGDTTAPVTTPTPTPTPAP